MITPAVIPDDELCAVEDGAFFVRRDVRVAVDEVNRAVLRDEKERRSA